MIKSNNPHLRGGEKQVSSILILKHSQLFGKYPNNLFVYVPLAGIPFPCARARQNQKKKLQSWDLCVWQNMQEHRGHCKLKEIPAWVKSFPTNMWDVSCKKY